MATCCLAAARLGSRWEMQVTREAVERWCDGAEVCARAVWRKRKRPLFVGYIWLVCGCERGVYAGRMLGRGRGRKPTGREGWEGGSVRRLGKDLLWLGKGRKCLLYSWRLKTY